MPKTIAGRRSKSERRPAFSSRALSAGSSDYSRISTLKRVTLSGLISTPSLSAPLNSEGTISTRCGASGSLKARGSESAISNFLPASASLSADASKWKTSAFSVGLTTATVSEKVMANFVLPVAAATALSGATVTITGNHTPAVKNIGNTTLTAKVYNVKRDVLTLGDLFYSDASVSTTLVDGKTPIGVIAYLGTDQWSENGVTLRDNTTTLQSHGLVVCLFNASDNARWSNVNVYASEFGETAAINNSDGTPGLKRSTDVSGYTNTKTLIDKNASDYPAASAAWNYTGLTAPATTTGWFLPCIQQWVKVLEGLGGMSESDVKWRVAFAPTPINTINTAMSKAGDGNYAGITGRPMAYWSCTELAAFDNMYTVVLNIEESSNYMFTSILKDASSNKKNYRVRPMLAF